MTVEISICLLLMWLALSHGYSLQPSTGVKAIMQPINRLQLVTDMNSDKEYLKSSSLKSFSRLIGGASMLLSIFGAFDVTSVHAVSGGGECCFKDSTAIVVEAVI